MRTSERESKCKGVAFVIKCGRVEFCALVFMVYQMIYIYMNEWGISKERERVPRYIRS